MQKQIKMKGFTLIELLVVIGILGILAAGLLASIDPLEQLKKGRDTNKRSAATEYLNALTRYYAIKGTMPWGTGATGPVSLTALNTTVTQSLITVGELKPEFARGLPAGSNPLTVVAVAGNSAIYVCFDPESKSISADPSTIYTSTANPPATGAVGACTATSVCYYCAR